MAQWHPRTLSKGAFVKHAHENRCNDWCALRLLCSFVLGHSGQKVPLFAFVTWIKETVTIWWGWVGEPSHSDLNFELCSCSAVFAPVIWLAICETVLVQPLPICTCGTRQHENAGRCSISLTVFNGQSSTNLVRISGAGGWSVPTHLRKSVWYFGTFTGVSFHLVHLGIPSQLSCPLTQCLVGVSVLNLAYY